MKKTAAIIFLLVFFNSFSFAEKLPDLRKQAAWGDKEKKEFLNFLKSDQAVPAGDVKYISQGDKGGGKLSKAHYFSVSGNFDSVIHSNGEGTKTEPATPGVKVLFGAHIFSWVRLYGGLKYNRMGQDKLDGERIRLSHLEIPVGLELALIPLGTPHTRYVLLRGGLSEHRFYGKYKKTDFKESLLGWTPAWNLALGYEWQLDNSNWRFHTLAEGYRSLSGGGKTPFYGLGITAGFVYTF